jgi:hypothetical protein
MCLRLSRLYSTTSKSTIIARESIQRMVISHPHIMNWNGGIIEKRLNSNSTFLWQDHYRSAKLQRRRMYLQPQRDAEQLQQHDQRQLRQAKRRWHNWWRYHCQQYHLGEYLSLQRREHSRYTDDYLFRCARRLCGRRQYRPQPLVC